MKKQKGITLIVLIITVIVMLILVGVTINIVFDEGIFEEAQDANKITQMEIDRQQLRVAVVEAIGDNGLVDFSYLDNNLPEGFTENNETYTSPTGNVFAVDENGNITFDENDIGGGTDSSPTVVHSYYYDENNSDLIKCAEHEDETYTIGEVYLYNPSIKENPVEIRGTESGVVSGIRSNLLSAEDFGINGMQTITQESTLTWLVLGYDKTDTNKLLITSATPITQTITLYGAEAYINGIDLANRICALYSGNNAVARAMTIEDVNECLEFELPEGKTGRCWDASGDIWVSGTLGSETIKLYNNEGETIWSVILSRANEALDSGKRITPEGANTIEALQNHIIDGYYYEVDDEGVTSSTNRKRVIFGENYNLFYFLATRGMEQDSHCADFGLGFISRDDIYSSDGFFFSSTGNEYYVDFSVFRPVVSLSPEI